MAIDRDRVEERAAYIRAQVKDVSQLMKSRTQEEILGDPWLLRGIRYALQTSIDAMIDIAYHLCAKGLQYGAVDGRDAVEKLASAGILRRDDVPVFQAMIAFRNRVVHGYLRVSDERVLEIASSELDDFDRFLSQVFAYLDLNSRSMQDP